MIPAFATATLTFLALLSIALWALQGSGRPAEARIRALALARQRGQGIAAIPFQQRIITPLLDAFGRIVAALLPGAFVGRTERRLVVAGAPMRPAVFYTMVLGLGALLAGAYVLLLIAAMNGQPPVIALMPAVLFALVGAYLPIFWLSAQAKARKRAMLRGLPDSLDLLTICVEAGLSLDGALHRVAQEQSGPLVEEIQQMLREIALGRTRREALQDMAARTEIADVRTFASAVIQAEQTGTSMARVLRVQSQRLRLRRRQRSEQEARRAPVKMVFPLVFCLMPSLFIFILGPIVTNAVEFLSG